MEKVSVKKIQKGGKMTQAKVKQAKVKIELEKDDALQLVRLLKNRCNVIDQRITEMTPWTKPGEVIEQVGAITIGHDNSDASSKRMRDRIKRMRKNRETYKVAIWAIVKEIKE